MKIGNNYIGHESNQFGYKQFWIRIVIKARFFYIQITNRPTFWVQLYWDHKHNYGKHIL